MTKLRKAKKHLQALARKAEQATPCLSYKKSLMRKLDPHIIFLSRRVLDPKNELIQEVLIRN